MRNLPRLSFAHLPTPVEPLTRLSARLGGPQLWIKRDDQTGLAFGGNKTRKLEFLIAEALAHGARTIITAGSIQSNHCRQTAAAAARSGLDCILVLSLPMPGSTPQLLTGNVLLDRLLGANIIWAQPGENQAILKNTFDSAWEAGKRPYLIPYGGSNPTGASGYAYAIKELLDQVASNPNIPMPDIIVFASSSGGTQAGLVAGARIFNFQGTILGISVDEEELGLKNLVAGLASQVCDLLDEPYSFSTTDIMVNASYLGSGYGVMGEAEKEAIVSFAREDGILLDPVYTGRAAAGLLDLIRIGKLKRGDTVLFWHTGGAPALFSEQYQSIIES